MSWQFNDQPLLDHFSLSLLPFSNDLQRLTLDYLYPRQIIAFEKNGVIYRLRFGIGLISNKLAYEIRAYNKEESYLFSTFATEDEPLASSIFREFKEKIIGGTKFEDVFYFDTRNYHRYIYSPTSDHTYVIFGIVPWDKVMIYRAYYSDINYLIGNVKDYEGMKRTTQIYRRWVEKYGEDWAKYPPVSSYASEIENYAMSVIS